VDHNTAIAIGVAVLFGAWLVIGMVQGDKEVMSKKMQDLVFDPVNLDPGSFYLKESENEPLKRNSISFFSEIRGPGPTTPVMLIDHEGIISFPGGKPADETAREVMDILRGARLHT
jgi:hypothetical protein